MLRRQSLCMNKMIGPFLVSYQLISYEYNLYSWWVNERLLLTEKIPLVTSLETRVVYRSCTTVHKLITRQTHSSTTQFRAVDSSKHLICFPLRQKHSRNNSLFMPFWFQWNQHLYICLPTCCSATMTTNSPMKHKKNPGAIPCHNATNTSVTKWEMSLFPRKRSLLYKYLERRKLFRRETACAFIWIWLCYKVRDWTALRFILLLFV